MKILSKPIRKLGKRMGQGFRSIDWMLFLFAALASIVGFFAIWTTDYARADNFWWVFPEDTIKQLIYIAIAIASFLAVLAFFSSKKPVFWGWLAAVAIVSVVILNIIVQIPGFGVEVNGAKRWLLLGGVQLQPSEFVKVGLILMLAVALASRSTPKAFRKGAPGYMVAQRGLDIIRRGWFLIPVVILCALIYLQSDLKSIALIAVCTVAMLLAAGCRSRRVFGLFAVASVAIALLVFTSPYRMDRIMSTFGFGQKTEQQIQADRYQSEQALEGFANGGWTGQGIGEGQVKTTLPVGTSDYVLVTVGEELGLIGSLFVVICVLAVVVRCIVLSAKAPNRRIGLYFFGLSVWLGTQTLANILMVTDVVPSMGIPLPFISAGGSSLISIWLALGVGMALRGESRSTVEEGRTENTRHRWRDGRTRLSRA